MTNSVFTKYKVFFIPLLIFCGIMLSYFLVVQSTLTSLSTTKDELDSGISRLNNITGKVNTLKKLDPEELKQRLELMEKAIPSTKDALSGFYLIQKLATDEGLGIESLGVSPGLISSSSGTKSTETTVTANAIVKSAIPFQVSVIGENNQLLSFIKKLNDLNSPIIIPLSINISQSGTKSSIQINASMLWLENPTQFGGEENPIPVLTLDEEKVLKYISNNHIDVPVGDQTTASSGNAKQSLF